MTKALKIPKDHYAKDGRLFRKFPMKGGGDYDVGPWPPEGGDEKGPDAPYVDKTGTMEKPNPLRDVFLEFPRAMLGIAKVTAFGAMKHAARGWRTFDHDYAEEYHRSKLGRHLLKDELEGPVNHGDGDLLHLEQAAWNLLAQIEHRHMKAEEESK
jgi:hypothetical protein